MLYVDKHRPHSFDKFIINKEIASNLKKLVANGDCPHILFYGPSGAGKKTCVMSLLREMYGSGVEKLKVENKPWKIDRPDRKMEIELTTVSSNFHVEMNPSDVGNQDRFIVQEIIKDMARNRPLDVQGQKGFKVLVLNEVDKLTKDAQHSLRRTMEKYSGACRLVMCCNNISKVLDAVKSRCLNVRIGAPTVPQICDVIQHVADKEHIQVPPAFGARIAENSERNLRRALLSLEACKVQQYPFQEGQAVEAMDWEMYVTEIANDILGEQNPKRLFLVRGKLYELLID
mmetsp:Transcript_31207/g.99507  ORF Transcript_31207/g.99507 Transcript_31207/m.99507 type:complete len:287 (-) Transcript_31207:349-1209(-)